MAPITSIDTWLKERGLDLTDDNKDPHTAAERADLAAAYMNDHTPTRYAGALPTHPDIQDWAADVIDHAITASARRLVVTVHTGPSLLLLGATGVGKTHETYGALRLISATGLHTPWIVTSAADLYARLRPRHQIDAEAEFRHIAHAPLLAVDDLGAAKTSEWVEEVNFRLVNHRYEQMLPTLFTSNVPPGELKVVLGDRVASRLAEMTRSVVIKGHDRRRNAS